MGQPGVSALKLIIVEDEPAHAELMERGIKREFPGVRIDCFEAIEDCLQQLDDHDPDMIISDYLLPGMNGLEFLEELQRRQRDIPVVVITGQGNENIAVRAMKLGAYDYIVKSGDFFSLVPSIVKKVIHQKELGKALQKSQALYEEERRKLNSILASMMNPLAVVNRDMRIDFANPFFESAFGADLVGQPYQTIFGQSSNAASECLTAIKKQQVQSMEFQDANGRTWEVTISPGIKSEQEVITSVLVFQDITERKAYEGRLQHLSEKTISVQEEERSRISRELHDELGQVLTALKFDAAWLKDHLPDGNAALENRCREMCGLIDGSLGVVRRISTDLRPGILDDMGLGAAVEWYASELERRSGIECLTLIDLPNKRLATHVETGIYRIVQEALTNVARHAIASTVTISMKQEGETLFIQITDDGIGIAKPAVENPLSTGISGMRERAEILSGIVEIEGSAGKGTRLNVQVPVVYR